MADLSIDFRRMFPRFSEMLHGSGKTGGVESVSYWTDREENARARSSLNNLAGSLVGGLSLRLGEFESALNDFMWAESDSGDTAPEIAVVTGDARNEVSARLRYGDEAKPFNKYFSAGFDKTALTDLAPGDYSFDLTLTDNAVPNQDYDPNYSGASLKITVNRGDTWGDVLDNVKKAVNDSDLPVRAEITFQSASGQKEAGLVRTGYMLGLSVNPMNPAQDLSLQFSSSGSRELLRSLDFKAVEAAGGAPTQTRYDLTASNVARPSTFNSAVFDPNAATTLSPGEYTFTVTRGDDSEDVSFTVNSGDTWEEVMQGSANALGGLEIGIDTRIAEGSRRSDLMSDYLMAGKYLSLSAESPKLTQRMSLKDKTGDFVSTMGFSASAEPGRDAKLTVNQTDYVSENGFFSLDSGHLVVGAKKPFGENKGVVVSEGVSVMEKSLEKAVAGYNNLRNYLLAQDDLWKNGTADLWRKAFTNVKDDLNNLGFKEYGWNNEISFSKADFRETVRKDPDKARSVIFDSLIEGWKKTNESIRAGGLDELLKPLSHFADNYPRAASVLDLVKDAAIIKRIG